MAKRPSPLVDSFKGFRWGSNKRSEGGWRYGYAYLPTQMTDGSWIWLGSYLHKKHHGLTRNKPTKVIRKYPEDPWEPAERSRLKAQRISLS